MSTKTGDRDKVEAAIEGENQGSSTNQISIADCRNQAE
jgi:hypothetical protein